MISHHYPALIIIIPLLTALLASFVGWINQRLSFLLSAAGLIASVFISLGMLSIIADSGSISYHLGGWAPPWGIAYQVDFINGIVLVIIFLVSAVNLFSAKTFIEKQHPEKAVAFYTLYLLFITGLAGIVITGDAFNLYVLLEISSLCGYALIALGSKRAALSSLNYLFMGTIGASFYLLGIGYLYIVTGTLNMEDLARLLPGLFESPAVMLAFAFCITGMFIKMALFPLHGWLPNAYSEATPAAAALVAPLTTKVMIYVMIRISLSVFTPQYVFERINIGNYIVWLAVIAMVMGSLLALNQTRIRRMLSYIIVVEVGYMVGGFWLGNMLGVTGAVLHIVNDAIMTLCLFMAAGTIGYVIRSDKFSDLAGLFKKMPITMAAFTVGALSVIGVPPTCGFFSKWYLLSGGIAAGHAGFVIALLLSSLINAVLFFRIFEICYFEPFSNGHQHAPEVRISEGPAGMVIPLAVSALLVIVIGFYAGDIAQHIMKSIAPMLSTWNYIYIITS